MSDREQDESFDEWYQRVMELAVHKYDLMSQSEVKSMNEDVFRGYYTDGYRPERAVKSNFQLED
jgi:hypothetical protein